MIIHNLATIYSARLINMSKRNTKVFFFCLLFVLITKNEKRKIKPRASGHDTIAHLQILKD